MAVILDTSVLVELERNNSELIEALKKISKFNREKPYISSLSVTELFFGIFKKTKDKQVKLFDFIRKFNILHTTFSSSVVLANFKNVLSKQGKKIPTIDLIIASIAMDNDLNLVTLDSHFNRIPRLNVLYLGK